MGNLGKMKKQSFFTITHNSKETYNIAKFIGKHIIAGTIITLNGDLGCGKTFFTQGLATGLDISDKYYITSPTYNIINEYQGRLPLYHIDFYRINEPSELIEIGFYDIIDGDGVTVIEWAEKFMNEIKNISIDIQFQMLDENSRNIKITIYQQQLFDILTTDTKWNGIYRLSHK